MKQIELEDFCLYRGVSCVKYSPNGGSAAFVVSQPDLKSNGYKSCIWLYRNGKTRQLTNGGKESSFLWKNEDTILFPGDREEKKAEELCTKYYEISVSGGEAKLAFTLPVPVQELIALKNGDYLVLGTETPGFEKLYEGSAAVSKALLKHNKDEEDYEVVSQVPWYWNGGGYTRGSYSALYYYDTKKKRLSRLTDAGMNVLGVVLGREEKEIYYFQIDYTVPKPEIYWGAELRRMDLGSRRAETLLKGRPDFVLCDCYAAESYLIVAASDASHGMNTDADFYRFEYESGELTLLSKYGMAIGSSVGSDVRIGGGCCAKVTGDTLWFVSTVNESANLYKLENGCVSPVIERGGSIDCFDVCDGKVLVSALWDTRPPELYDESGRRITDLNASALKGRYVAKPEPICVASGDARIRGFVLKPFGFDENRKYPVIFDIHGGPKTVYGDTFYHEMQYWAGKGYFVIFCNPTGSDGRGGDFMDIFGKYGTVDYENLMDFCDGALERYPQMDREAVFETGGSYGGFMTNWIIGHTDRFRACASQRSISNWLSFSGTSDIGYDFTRDQHKADPWENAAALWDFSPLKYADQVKTPTLFIHSFEDYRCPIEQGYQMYTALVTHGVEARMILFRGENHELSRSGKPKHRVRRLKEITEWFENHKG